MPYAPPNARGKNQRALRRAQNKQVDDRRGSAKSRGYGRDWEQARLGHLQASPFCKYCELKGVDAGATLVDHLYPHRGDMVLFWNEQWWVSSCSPCHSGFKQRLEAMGRIQLDRLADQLGLPRLVA